MFCLKTFLVSRKSLQRNDSGGKVCAAAWPGGWEELVRKEQLQSAWGRGTAGRDSRCTGVPSKCLDCGNRSAS